MKFGDTFEALKYRQILSSRGEPTLEIELHTSLGIFRASCPSGASTGTKEAKVIVDNDANLFFGKSIFKAMDLIKKNIIPELHHLNDTDVSDQKQIDEFLIMLDGTDDKSKLGANVILPISTAMCRLGAASKKISLREHVADLCSGNSKMPYPYFNVINGGVHAGNNLVFQEIMVSFHNEKYFDNYKYGAEFYNELRKVVSKKYGKIATTVGDEGGFAPPISTLDEALDLIIETQKRTNYPNFKIAIDSAASEFFRDGQYILDIKGENKKKLQSSELCDFYVSLLKKYSEIQSIEDPLAEDDLNGWEELNKRLEGKINIVGDDLTVTNAKYIEKAAKSKLCNTLLVKLNQVGTVTETIEAVKCARKYGMKIMVSHRSGETEDTFISDFAVGIGADYIKAGATCRGERVAKYNQLLRIAEMIEK